MEGATNSDSPRTLSKKRKRSQGAEPLTGDHGAAPDSNGKSVEGVTPGAADPVAGDPVARDPVGDPVTGDNVSHPPACKSPSGSAPNRTKSHSGGKSPAGSSAGKKSQRRRFTWSESLEEDFNKAVFDIGLTCATPKLLLERMPAVDGFTSEHIKSHLQKKRLHRQRAKEALKKSDGNSAEVDGGKGLEGESAAAAKDGRRRRKKRESQWSLRGQYPGALPRYSMGPLVRIRFKRNPGSGFNQ